MNKMLRLEAILALSILAMALLLLGAVGTAFAQTAGVCNDDGLNCDHYLTYLLDKSIQPVTVTLRDQFIGPTDFAFERIERLFNPVRKLHEGLAFTPKRPDLHYLAYRVQPTAQFAPRVAFIENQFERRVITVTQPRYLLTPTGKKKIGIPIERVLANLPPNAADKLIAAIVPPVPQDANHYLCYDVEPYPIGKGVFLRDQFQNRQFEVIQALYLCNPTEKRHNDKVSPIVDENNHLMCYETTPHNIVNRKVITHDQFGIKSQKAVRTEELCLPTKKTLPHCTRPNEEGTAVVFDEDTEYQSTGGQIVIIPAPVVGTGLSADAALMSGPSTVINRSGTPAPGETYTFETEMLSLSLSSGRTVQIPTSGEIKTTPRTPGDPVQSFDTDMFRLQGQLPPGDPDFDLLRIVAGTGFGMPSPGHTTLTQLPDGNWNVDSFFDITYRIDFVGAPGGLYEGQSGSTTGTIRLEDTCPPSVVPPAE